MLRSNQLSYTTEPRIIAKNLPWPKNRVFRVLAVGEFRFAFVHKGVHAFLLVIGSKERVK